MQIKCRSNVSGEKNDIGLLVSMKAQASRSSSATYAAFLWCAIFLMLSVVPAPAQIRLHDAANDELAKKTRDAFAEFSKGDGNVFETMISNTLALKEATLAQLYDMNRQSRQDRINRIPVMTWTELDRAVLRAQSDFLTAYRAAQLILNPSSASATSRQSALDAAKAQLEVLQKEKAKKMAALKDVEVKLGDLKKSLEVLKAAVAALNNPVKKLSDLAQFKDLKDVWTKIKETKDWFDAAEKASNAPGLQLTILDLAVQHQNFEVERLQLELEKSDALMKIAERIAERVGIVWGTGKIDDITGRLTEGLFNDIYMNILPCASGSQGCPENPFVTDQTRSQQVLETAGRLAKAAKEEVGKPLMSTMQLRDLLDVLGRYVAVVGYHRFMMLADAIEAGTDTHLFSIRESALNMKDREMLVSHGLDGLAAYYAGGLKPEEIANFFRAAQSIGVAVLAGRVK